MDYNRELLTLENEGIVVHTPSMLQIYQKAEKLAHTFASVLIYGESGVGKNKLAEYIQKKGPLARAPFIRINCNAISSELFASELFGYMPNAFTGASPKGKVGLLEAADHGTILFDEINELSAENQTLLLHFLQNKTITPIGSLKSKEIHAHIICTSGQNLLEMIRKGTFRSDLYYRICVANIYVPPIRERKEEIPCLIRHFIRQYAAEYQVSEEEPQISDERMERLCQLHWRGNIREIQNLAQQICLAEDSAETIDAYIRQRNFEGSRYESSPSHPDSEESRDSFFQLLPVPDGTPVLSLKDAVRAFECAYIQQVIDHSSSLQSAAQKLDISFRTLCRKKAEYDIPRR